MDGRRWWDDGFEWRWCERTRDGGSRWRASRARARARARGEGDATRADATGAPVTASGETDYDAMLRRRRAERAKREATSSTVVATSVDDGDDRGGWIAG